MVHLQVLILLRDICRITKARILSTKRSVLFIIALWSWSPWWPIRSAETLTSNMQEFIVNSRGNKLFTCRWTPQNCQPKAMIFICHGTNAHAPSLSSASCRHKKDLTRGRDVPLIFILRRSSILVTTIALDLSSAGIAAECSISMRGNNTIF